MSALALDNPLAALRPGTAPDPAPKKTADEAQARKSAQQFEGYFLAQFVDRMFQGVPKDSLAGGGNGEEIFRGLMSQEYGKAMAAHGGVGIADQVYREILKTQEVK
jgi:Rod binding domain-containing protein